MTVACQAYQRWILSPVLSSSASTSVGVANCVGGHIESLGACQYMCKAGQETWMWNRDITPKCNTVVVFLNRKNPGSTLHINQDFGKTWFANNMLLLGSNCHLFAHPLSPEASETPVRPPATRQSIRRTALPIPFFSYTQTHTPLPPHTHTCPRSFFTAGTPAPRPRPSSSPRQGTRSS